MRRIGWMLVGGLAVLAVQATSAAEDRVAQLLAWSGDCSRGSIELRLDCLTREVEQIKARLDGRIGEVVPLGPMTVPTPATPVPAPPPPR
jgi:hypothetical protein